MISHVSVCLLAHEEKGLISDTFRHTKWEYSFRFVRSAVLPLFFLIKLFEQGYKLYLS